MRDLLVRLRRTASATALVLATAATAQAHAETAQTVVLKPYTGNLSAFTGNLSAFTGNLSAFTGNLSAFYGDIFSSTGNLSAFTGNLSAFTGNLSAFTGNLSAFGGTVTPSTGNLSAFTGNLSAFQTGVDPFWGDLSRFSTGVGAGVATSNVNYAGLGAFFDASNTQWRSLAPAWGAVTDKSSKTTLALLSAQFDQLEATSETFWGAAVRSKTGKSFHDGFAKNIYAKYGFDPDNASSLSKLSELNRNLFILDWYDGLMSFTGTDHVDWWMRSANWSPALTQTQGSGGAAVIGLLDFQVTSAAVAQGELVSLKGVSNFSNGHGAAVASLMVAPHDGQGIMGIAPQATVVAYNPFDSSATTNWTDVTNGVVKLTQNGAGVVNLSLGVPGWTVNPDWKGVFTNATVAKALTNTAFVIAAGNDGLAQTANVDLGKGVADNILIVGSIGPTDAISSFSNKPGTACLTLKCEPGTRLMDRFITAPGELVLVDDGAGGVTRKIGTSFAAPLVTGAVALLQDRWPWLAQHPEETTSIILKSARDLGAPGTDAVFGVGALDVTASQSPLSFDSLKFFTPKAIQAAKAGAPGPAPAPAKTEDAAKTLLASLSAVDTKTVRATTQAQLQQFDTAGLFYYAYEQIGDTFRDFAIPLSSKLVGQNVLSAGGTQERFQQYIYTRMTDWMTGGSGVIHETKPGPGGKYRYSFSNAGNEGVSLENPWGLNMVMSTKPWAATPLGYRQSQIPVQTDLRLASRDGAQSLRFGYGDAAGALSGLSAFASTSTTSGMSGSDPVLGFASGGAYADYTTRIAPRLSLSAGWAQKQARLDLTALSGPDRLAMKDMADYRATAGRLGLSYAATRDLTLTTSVTHLDEPNAMLGLRSTDPGDFAGGSTTEAATFGAEWRPTDDLRISGTATMGSTRDSGGERTFSTTGDGLKSSAYELAVDKLGLFDGGDRLRLTLSQPLTVESGRLAFNSVQVTDRTTGELGVTTQYANARPADRRYVGEVLYGRALGPGAGEWGVFGRVESRSEYTNREGVQAMAGARWRLSY